MHKLHIKLNDFEFIEIEFDELPTPEQVKATIKAYHDLGVQVAREEAEKKELPY